MEIIKNAKEKDFYAFSKELEQTLNDKVAAFIPDMKKGVIEDSLKLNKLYDE